MNKRLFYLTSGAALVIACGDPRRDIGGGGTAFATGTDAGESDADPGTTAAVDDGDTAADDADTTAGDGNKFDVGTDETGGGSLCKVGELDAALPCRQQAPPDSFTPAIQWTWTGATQPYSVVTPLVANLTDDNGDGDIDLCDVPDIVVLAYGCDVYCSDARLYVLDGATGAEHFMIDHPLRNAITPALGDVDNDGLSEIVAVDGETGKLVMFEHDGTLAWVGAAVGSDGIGAIALADLDADGDVEILHNKYLVSDHQGKGVAHLGMGFIDGPMTPAAADLDGDGDLEIVRGSTAWHHDGSVYYENPDLGIGASDHVQVANLDDDPEPEIVVSGTGLWVLEHDGTTKLAGLTPTGEPLGDWGRPVTIHDFDGDGDAELAVKSELYYSMIERDGTLVWSAPVQEGSFGSGGTAFDFLGDGTAEAIYADEHSLFVFDDLGAPLLQVPRTSFTAIEYPVVADVDNDGSAEIVVVSNRNQWGGAPSPTVQVIRDEQDRWIPARRIWNQHTYHVTNVREDGTIPQHVSPHWQQLNTFRTNAQVEGGQVCDPAG